MPGLYKSLPLATQLGEGLSSYASDAELVNLMLVPNPPGSRTPFHVAQVPALGTVVSLIAGEIRGACVHGGYIFFVRGTTAYYFDGTTVTAVPAGNVPGSGNVQMVDAGTHCVAVSTAGARAITTAESFTVTPPAGSFSDVAYQDGYTIYVRDGTDEFYISSLDDPTTVGALDFTTADSGPGDIIGIISDHRELVIFKEFSVEFWYNAGSADFPFARSSPGVAERGLFSAGSVAKYDNRVFWLGEDLRVYSMQGYQPQPVSTAWVEHILLTNVSKLNAAYVRASAFAHDGRAYYQIDLGFNTGWQLVLDLATGLWHKRVSPLTAKVSDVVQYQLSSGALQTWAAVNVSGSASLYRWRSDVFNDAGAGSQTTRTLTMPAVAASGERVRMPELYLDMEKHSAASTVNLTFSDDGGATYSAAKTADGTLARCRWNRLGSFFQRILRFTFSTNSRIAIMGVHARIEAGL